MNATLVGADRLGNIPALLEAQGIRVLCHISGRAASAQRRTGALPKGTQLLILFTDFLGHNVMKTFRQAAQEEGVPVVACRRSASCVVCHRLLYLMAPDATQSDSGYLLGHQGKAGGP